MIDIFRLVLAELKLISVSLTIIVVCWVLSIQEWDLASFIRQKKITYRVQPVVLLGMFGGGTVCRPVLQILTLFQNKECHFPSQFSDLAYVYMKIGRISYVIFI